MTCGHDGRIVPIQAVLVDRPHAQGTAPSLPRADGQRRVGYKMWCAVHVHTMITALVECVRDFGHPPVQGNVASDCQRSFRLETVSARGSLEFEAAVIRDVNLFV